VFTAATVVIVGFLAVLAGVTLQRFRQSLQDQRELRARVERNARRVRREVLWAAGTALVLWVAYEVIEHGGLR
jgi:type II secretory pathway pseudopilin PulG